MYFIIGEKIASQEKYCYQDDLLKSASIYSIHDGNLKDLSNKLSAPRIRKPIINSTTTKSNHQKSSSLAMNIIKQEACNVLEESLTSNKKLIQNESLINENAMKKAQAEKFDSNEDMLGNTAENNFIVPNIRSVKNSSILFFVK